jgi:mRNA interferase RelE/StbE
MARYKLFIEPEVYRARKHLPGNVRQQVRRAIDDLSEEPRSSRSKLLDVTGIDVPPGVEMRRLRMPPWRIIYGVNDNEGWVWVLAMRQRPPYDYEDLDDLASKLK